MKTLFLFFVLVMITFNIQAAFSPDVLLRINDSYIELEKEKNEVLSTGTINDLQDFLAAQKIIKTIASLENDIIVDEKIESIKHAFVSEKKSCFYQEKIVKIIAGDKYGDNVFCNKSILCNEKIGDNFRKMLVIKEINDFIFIQKTKPAIVSLKRTIPQIAEIPKKVKEINSSVKGPIRTVAPETKSPRTTFNSPVILANHSAPSAVETIKKEEVIPTNIDISVKVPEIAHRTITPVQEKAIIKVTPSLVHESIRPVTSAHVNHVDRASFDWNGIAYGISGSNGGTAGVLFITDYNKQQLVVKTKSQSLNQAFATFMLKQFGLETIGTRWCPIKSECATKLHNIINSAKIGVNGDKTSARIKSFNSKYDGWIKTDNHEGLIIMEKKDLKELNSNSPLSARQIQNTGKLFIADIMMCNYDRFFMFGGINNFQSSTKSGNIVAFDQEMFDPKIVGSCSMKMVNSNLSLAISNFNKLSSIKNDKTNKERFRNGVLEMKETINELTDVENYIQQKVEEFKQENNLQNTNDSDNITIQLEMERLKVLWKERILEMKGLLQNIN